MLRPNAGERVSKGKHIMTAPFDLPVHASTTAPASAVDFGCCSRAAIDTPPALVGAAARLMERTLEFLVRAARKIVQESIRVLKQRPWM